MKYPAIIFDADNTILDFTWSEADALRQTLRETAGVTFSPEIHIPLYREINKQIWNEFENGEIDSENLKTERFRRFFSAIEIDVSPGEVGAAYLKYLSQSARFIAGAEELLQKLTAAGVCLALVTNGLTRVQKPRFRAAGIDRYFSTILISEELGTAKPDPEIFTIACTAMNVSNKREVLMVGDNLNSDIRGGNGFGIDTCWFNPERLSRENGILPTYEIRALRELGALLDLR